MYCVKCRNKTETTNLHHTVSKNKRPMLRGKCTVCGTIKTQFVSMKKGGDLADVITSKTHNIKLPWARYPGEIHLPGNKTF